MLNSNTVELVSELCKSKSFCSRQNMRPFLLLLLLSVHANHPEDECDDCKRHSDWTHQEDDCSICLQKLDNELNAVMTRCKHTFHAKCFKDLTKIYDSETCPICRGYIGNLSPVRIYLILILNSKYENSLKDLLLSVFLSSDTSNVTERECQGRRFCRVHSDGV